ncbi:hypothetical protein GJ496_005083 [Pomphorhynchus laevis]|nr:hypothetical protein GJ496_005083 [Pomphorhynchus laevis]
MVKAKPATRQSKSSRAGVLFPVARVHRYLKQANPKKRITMSASIYSAAVLEYLAAEVLELGGNAARDHKKSRVTPRHLFLAIAIDEELKRLLRGVTISQGGVLPNINPALVKKSSVAAAIADGMISAAVSSNPAPAGNSANILSASCISHAENKRVESVPSTKASAGHGSNVVSKQKKSAAGKKTTISSK